jgi:hypothetical protein
VFGTRPEIAARPGDDIARHEREREEHQRDIAPILWRMEQHDARSGAIIRDIRRILAAML